MSEVKCGVVHDLIPLVVDDVACEESKALVNAHMETCETCRAYYAGMSAQLTRMAMPEDGPTSTFVKFSHRMEKRVRIKRVLIALTAAIVALCVAIMGGVTVLSRMNTYDYMPIEQTRSWLWRESDGDVHLLVQMLNGQGWYHSVNTAVEGNIIYLIPQEPQLKLWNRGNTDVWNEEYQLDLVWENGQLYYCIPKSEPVFNEQTGECEIVESETRILVELVRWGFSDKFTTLYEKGDVIPTMAKLQAMLEGLDTDDSEEILELAEETTKVPSDETTAED